MTSPSIRRPGTKEPPRTWAWGLQLLRNQATAINRVPGQLTRDQAAALILAAMKLAPRAGHPFMRWYELALPVLGFYKEGDRFRVDEPWRKSMSDPAATELLWRELEALVAELDGAGIAFTMPDATAGEAKYKQLARLAYDRLQRERGVVPPLPRVPKPPGIPKPPVTLPTPTLPLPDLSGGLKVILILGGLYYLSKRKG